MAAMIKTIFDKKLGHFLHVKPDNMRCNPTAGQISLKEAEFISDVFDQLHFPFTLKGGFIEEMSMEMSMGMFSSGAAKIVIRNVFLVFGPHRSTWTWQHVHSCKSKLVDTVMKVYELKPTKKRAPPPGRDQQAGGGMLTDWKKRFMDDMKKKLLGMLEVHISNIHYRYEDADTQDLPFACGFKIGLVHVTSKSHGDHRTTGEWRNSDKVFADPFFNQCILARRVSAYWDLGKDRESLFATKPVGGQEVRKNFVRLNLKETFSACVVEKILDQFPPQHKRRRFLEGPGFRERLDFHQYMIFPVGFNAHVTVNNPTPAMKAQKAPLKDADVIFEPVEVALDSEQLRSINELMSHEKEFRRKDQLIRTRPRELITDVMRELHNARAKGHSNSARVDLLEQSLKTTVRLWWQHAFQAVRLLCGIPKMNFEEEELRKKAKIKDEYIRLCIEEMVAIEQDRGAQFSSGNVEPGQVARNLTNQLRDMQVMLPLQEILEWRLAAKIEKEKRYAGGVQRYEEHELPTPEEEEAEKAREQAEREKAMPNTMQVRVHFRAFQAYFLIVADQLWRTAVFKNTNGGTGIASEASAGQPGRSKILTDKPKALARQLVLRAQVINVRMEAVQRGRGNHRTARWIECGIGGVNVINCNARKAQNSARHMLTIQPFDQHDNQPLCIFVGATMLTVVDRKLDEGDAPIHAMLEPSQGVSSHLSDFSHQEPDKLKKLGFLQDHINDVGKTMMFVFVRMGQVKALDYTPFRRRMMHFVKRGRTEQLTDLVRRPSPLALDRELLVKLQRKVEQLTGKSNMLGFIEGIIDGVRGRLVDHYNSQHVLCKEMSLAPMQWKALRSGCPQTFHMQFHQLQRPNADHQGGSDAPHQGLPNVALNRAGNPYGLLPWKMSMLLLPKAEFAMGLESSGPTAAKGDAAQVNAARSDPVGGHGSAAQIVDMADPGTLVLAGCHFLKWGRNGKAKRRFVLFDESLDAIVWKNLHTDKYPIGAIPMAKIQDISTGIQTPVLQKVVSQSIKADHVLSIISVDRTLDLQAESMAVRDRWLAGLKSRYKRYVQKQSVDGAEPTPLPPSLERRLKTYPEKFRSDRCSLKSTYRKLQAVTALGKTWKPSVDEARKSNPADKDANGNADSRGT